MLQRPARLAGAAAEARPGDAPRLWAAATVSIFLVSLCSFAGIAGGYFFNVIVTGGSAGSFLSSFTALATRDGRAVPAT